MLRTSARRLRRAFGPRVLVVSLLLAAVAVVTPAPEPAAAQAPTQYQNPLVNGQTRNPAIVKVGTTFYAYFNGLDYAGHQNVPVYSSPDLVNWSQASPLNALPDASAGAWASTTTGYNFSSPSVVEIPANPAASRYVMYFTGVQVGTGSKCIGVATASAPAGPFVGAASPLICPAGGAQDPSLVHGGTTYPQLVYRKNGSSPGIYNQRLTADGLGLHASSPYLLYAASPTWWHDGHVDRPSVAVGGGKVYLFFSGGAPGSAGRAIGWSACTTYIFLITSCKQQVNFGTWIAPNAEVTPIGGMQVFRDGASQWVVYDAGSKMRVDKLCFSHEQPRTNGPSTTPQALARDTGSCSADIPGAVFAVDSVTDSLVVGQTAKVSYRDGGATVPLDGRLLWMFSDTLTRSPCHALSNSAALGVPAPGATGPNWTTEPVDADGCPSPFIPFLPEETSYNATNWSCSPSPTCPGKRIILWEVGAVPLANGTAMSFFWKMIHDADNDGEIRDEDGNIISEDGNGDGYADEGCGICYEALGHGLAKVDPGSTVIDRSAAASPVACNPTCLFVPSDFATPDDPNGEAGVRRPFVDGDHVYAWVGGKLARVARADMQTRSAWRFWTDTPPPDAWSTAFTDADNVPGLRVGLFEVAVGKVDYNPYLDRFVNMTPESVFSRNKLYMQTAPAPEGPWTTATFVYDANANKCPTDAVSTYTPYGFIQAPALATDGGRSIYGVYARPGPSFGQSPSCPGQMRMVEVRLQ